MTQRILLFIFVLTGCFTVEAQELLTPSFSFSHKKTAYITLKDGTELQGNIKDIDRKKGLIDFIKLKDGDGKKHKLKPESIAYMYLPPNGVDKLGKKMAFLTDAEKWTDEKLNQDLLTDGYVYFENANVKLKRKNRELLMQLLNPTYSGKVKVYHDPMAKKTMSVGIGAVKLAGGHAKSYFLKLGDATAYKVKKKDYNTEFKPLWKKCKDLSKMNSKEIKWNDLTQHVLTYTECSE